MFHSLVVADRSSYWPPDHLSFSKFQQQGRCSAHNQDPIETDLEMKTQVGIASAKYHPASKLSLDQNSQLSVGCLLTELKQILCNIIFIIMARLC